jgi:threonine dehydrogenase-like Zn-dependent dehydrogenase
VYASLFPAGAGTAHEGLVDGGRLQAGETVLIIAAGGVGSAAAQIAAAIGARPLGVASASNHDYPRSLGASEVFDYRAANWIRQVRAAVPGGVDLLLDAVGGQTRDQAIGALRDGGLAIFIVLQGPPAKLGTGAGRGPARARQDRAANRAVAATPLRVFLAWSLPRTVSQVVEEYRRYAKDERVRIVSQAKTAGIPAELPVMRLGQVCDGPDQRLFPHLPGEVG